MEDMDTFENDNFFEEDELVQNPLRDNPSPHWTEEQKKEITEQWNYHNDMVTYLNNCWKNGPSDDPMPKKVNGKILNLLQRKVCQTVAKLSNDIEHMTNLEFHNYLLSNLITDTDCETTNERIPTLLSELPEYLNKQYRRLKFYNHHTLVCHFQMGKCLIAAKEKVDCEKRKKNIKSTWKIWLEENTNIKEACARRHREIAELVSRFSKLEKLSLSYAEFLKIKNKIRTVFTDDKEIGEDWK
jgi:hypothetical protein